VTIEVIDDHRLTLTLNEPYVPFIENLTVGILPRALWSELPTEQIPFSQNNTEPIGTGPYRITDVQRTPSGLISAYELSAFANPNRPEPNITTLVFNFYQNESEVIAALEAREISGTPSLSPQTRASFSVPQYRVIEGPLPRTFGVYFNQNRSIALRDQAARQALSVALNRQELIDTVLFGFGIPTTSPVPPGFLDVALSATATVEQSSTYGAEAAKDILRAGGWDEQDNGTWRKKIGDDTATLALTLATANTDTFIETATYVQSAWQAIGVEVTLAPYEQTDLVQSIIRPRDFEAVLYGADIGRSIDLYTFWHSSQKSDPGLNIAQYANIDSDQFLETTQNSTDEEERREAIRSFDRLVKAELPAVFLYTPTFGYVIDDEVNVSGINRLSRISERFANVHAWHVRSNNVWPVFSDE
jgi:peptide/nickel transport system substrate-binding protein